MNLKYLIFAAMAMGLILMAGCSTPNTSRQPWDRPIHVEDNSTYNSPDFSVPDQ